MRKVILYSMSAMMLLSACNSSSSTISETTTAAVTTAAQETTTAGEEQTTEAETTTEAEKPDPDAPWVPVEAPAVNNAKSAEEMLADQKAICEKGTLLFAGELNEGYYGNFIDTLKGASDTDSIAIIYSCDDVTHGGWGVLGLKVNKTQVDIKAYADNPDQVRMIIYSVKELAEAAGVENAAEITEFSLGAWNGGHIHGLYFLEGDVSTEMTDYVAQAEKDAEIIHTYDGSLSNENAIENAVVVYDYLKSVYGEYCLTGQMESTWKGSPDYEMNYIEKNSGKLPAIRGLDFMHNDFAGVTARAKEWWEKGGIPTICWHTGADFASAYNESKNDNINWDEAFDPESETYKKLLAGMDRAVPYLQQLEDAGVPVLWRPFHELDGGWFWWSKGGSENFVKLWQLMYSRYTDFWGLDNLIWVFGYSHNGVAMESWYPGDNYVDLIGGDSYTPGANGDLFEEVSAVSADNMPIVFHECGNIPSEQQMKDAGTDWLFFMTWHTDYITDKKYNTTDHINEVYNSDYFITLDELPAFK